MVDAERLTLEELARAAGMTARNVRAYQTRGLIPPPLREGRRSVYGRRHVERLVGIRRAREQGASLLLVAAHLGRGGTLDEETLLGGWPAPAARVHALGQEEERTELGELLTRLGAARDADLLAAVERLVEAGVFSREGVQVFAGRALASTVAALQQHGVEVLTALRLAVRAAEAAAGVAQAARSALDGSPAVRSAAGHLAELAAHVVEEVLTTRLDPGRPQGSPSPGSA